jgi:penicillin-binding protein 1A
MTAALPRLKATPIPGGVIEPPPQSATDPDRRPAEQPNATPEGPAAETPALGTPPPAQLPY